MRIDAAGSPSGDGVGHWREVRETFLRFTQALREGEMDIARVSFDALMSFGPSSPDPLGRRAKLAAAIRSGDADAARSAYAELCALAVHDRTG